MSELPQVPGERLVRALEKAGFYVKGKRGSHVIMVHKKDLLRRAVVPVHGSKPIRPGTFRAILKGAKLSVEEIRNLI
ncbi:MAG: type II toxin-antitoxin system HicA family toxin [Bacillota bacterium]